MPNNKKKNQPARIDPNEDITLVYANFLIDFCHNAIMHITGYDDTQEYSSIWVKRELLKNPNPKRKEQIEALGKEIDILSERLQDHIQNLNGLIEDHELIQERKEHISALLSEYLEQPNVTEEVRSAASSLIKIIERDNRKAISIEEIKYTEELYFRLFPIEYFDFFENPSAPYSGMARIQDYLPNIPVTESYPDTDESLKPLKEALEEHFKSYKSTSRITEYGGEIKDDLLNYEFLAARFRNPSGFRFARVKSVGLFRGAEITSLSAVIGTELFVANNILAIGSAHPAIQFICASIISLQMGLSSYFTFVKPDQSEKRMRGYIEDFSKRLIFGDGKNGIISPFLNFDEHYAPEEKKKKNGDSYNLELPLRLTYDGELSKNIEDLIDPNHTDLDGDKGKKRGKGG